MNSPKEAQVHLINDRLKPSSEPLWFIDKNKGSLIIDHSTLDKPYARVKRV